MSKFKVEVGNHMTNPQSSESYWKRKVTLSFQKIGNKNHLLIFCGKQKPLRICHWMNGEAKWINTLESPRESLGENRMGWVALSLITVITEFSRRHRSLTSFVMSLACLCPAVSFSVDRGRKKTPQNGSCCTAGTKNRFFVWAGDVFSFVFLI